MKTTEEKRKTLIDLNKQFTTLRYELWDEIMEIPMDFLRKKGFIFTQFEEQLINSNQIDPKNKSYHFEFGIWCGQIECLWYYDRVSLYYYNDPTKQGKSREWSYLKTDFETYYKNNLKKDFEPKTPKQ